MRKLLLLLLLVPGGIFAQFSDIAYHLRNGPSLPAKCQLLTGDVFIKDSGGSEGPYYCSAPNTWTAWTGGGGGGATTALDNLASVNINASLLFQSGKDVGSTTKPPRNIFFYGSGTYSSTYIELTGTPTGNRVITLPDASVTFTATNGITVALGGGGTVLYSGDIVGTYFALAGSNAILAGTGNTCASSATTDCFSLTPIANPSAPHSGALNVNAAGWFDWYTSTAWKYPVASATTGQDLSTLATGFVFNTTTTGVLSSIGSSGTGNVCLVTSCTMVTPVLGAATATSLLATGIVDGKAPVDVTTGTTATLGGTYKSGYTFNENATAGTAVAYTLPTAALGLQYCVGNAYNGSAANTGVITLNTSASGQFIIFSDGTLSASGGNVTSGGAGGDFACVVGVDSTHWSFHPSLGTWSKH